MKSQATDCKLILFISLCALAACGKAPSSQPEGLGSSAAAVPAPESGAPTETITPPSEAPSAPTAQATQYVAVWSDRPATAPWTSAVAAEVGVQLANFEKARDRESYCPGYSVASSAQRVACWIRLISAVAKFESGFNPANVYKESDGVYSVGLLQLSPGECVNAETVTALKDPVQNLQCGIRKMASLIARYGYVTTPDNRHGAAAYWSTLRAPYVSGSLHLGKRTEVIALTQVFRQTAP